MSYSTALNLFGVICQLETTSDDPENAVEQVAPARIVVFEDLGKVVGGARYATEADESDEPIVRARLQRHVVAVHEEVFHARVRAVGSKKRAQLRSVKLVVSALCHGSFSKASLRTRSD